MKLGLIARSDQSGLGVQSWEFARHMRPDRILHIGMGNLARGQSHPEWYDDFDVVEAGVQVDKRAATRFLDGLDVVFTAEGTYRDGFGDLCAQAGTVLVVQANPELYRADVLGPHLPVFPTSWELGRYAEPQIVLPVPVDRDRLPYRHRDRVETFVHTVAPAMKDRNGTQLVLAALSHVEQPCRVIFHVPEGVDPPAKMLRRRGGRVGNVEWECPRRTLPHYWDLYDGADALLLPRRYGGLSLPMQEAASLGMPAVTLDLPPQAGEDGMLTVRATDPRPERMKGGTFDVWACKPTDLAAAMDWLVAHPGLVFRLSIEADRTAAVLDWEKWQSRYARFFEWVVENYHHTSSR